MSWAEPRRASASVQSSSGKLRPFFASVTRVGDACNAARICAELASGTADRNSAAQPAASGAKYGRVGIEYWEHQGEASVDFFGNKLSCKPVR